ncbi:MAG: peptidase S8, partial [Cyclobacteriaceae bacterium]
LSSEQLRKIILESTVKFGKLEVAAPGQAGKLVEFADLSRTGGIVNAYEAVKLAESYKVDVRKN